MRLFLLCSLIASLGCCLAQNPAASVISPDVHPDGRVTFRLFAPKAQDAAVFGDWMAAGGSEKMTKAADGIWSATLGPLRPGDYIYNFILDGINIADPVNPRIKLRARTSASLVEVGGPDAFWQPRDVPHGAVRIEWQKAATLGGETRWIWIYTPPGYDRQAKRRYPVLYLFHGSNDIAGGWVLAGHANFILDNLLAAGKAEPMIVVMPFGHAVPFGSPKELQAKNVDQYEQYLLKDVMPFVESGYRVAPGRENRAIAGLSMGGGQALQIGFGHTDLFSSIAAFSAAVPADFETRFASVLSDAPGTNAKMRNIWFACGRQDSLFARSEKLSALLRSRGVEHTWKPTEGNHTYTYWREYLNEFAPLLFRAKGISAKRSKT